MTDRNDARVKMPLRGASRSSEASTDIQHRRERGRAAQAAFRKRQIDTIRNQEEQIRTLSQALGVVDQTRYRLKTAIGMFKALGSEGIPTQLTEDFLKQLEQALQHVPKDILQQQNPDQTHDDTGRNSVVKQPETEIIVSQKKHIATQNVSLADTSLAVRGSHAQCAINKQTGITSESLCTSNVEPRHDFPSVRTPLMPTLSIRVPPVEMLPYLPDATRSTQTFAYTLYWAGVSFAYQLIVGTKESRTASRMLTYHFRRESRQAIQKKLWARLSIQRGGVFGADVSPHSAPMYAELIMQDMIDNGEDVHRYLGASDVELYFRRRYVDPDNLHFSNPALMTDPLEARNMSASLVQYLTLRAICFGDGPRYHIDHVEEAFQLATGGAFAKFPSLHVEDYPANLAVPV